MAARLRREVRPSLKEIAGGAAAEAERQAIRRALHATRGNKSEAARLLRVDYTPLHLKMKRYAIDAADFRASCPSLAPTPWCQLHTLAAAPDCSTPPLSRVLAHCRSA